MSKLEEMRQRLMEMENRRAGTPSKGKSSNSDNSVFPFWNMKDNEESKVRFLPDGDSSNVFFWVEKQVINIPFSGIIGDSTASEVVVTVPCIEMYGTEYQCPIHQEIRPWYKQGDKSLEELASVYWKKRTFITQGFVRDTKLPEADKPENPIRTFLFKPQVYNLIKAIIMDPDNAHSPTDYEQGFDFYLSKTKNGKWADYSTSRWARSSTPLSQFERDAIDKYGLNDLTKFLPKKPSAEDLKVQLEMFEASLDGGKYDPEKWGQYYKPKGFEIQTKAQVQSASVTASRPVLTQEERDDIPFEVETPVATAAPKVEVAEPVAESATSQSVKDILARVQARNKTA
jgi:hypothetical protein